MRTSQPKPARGNFMFVESGFDGWVGGWGKEAASQKSEITIVKTKWKHSKTSSHGRNEMKIQLQFTRRTRGCFLELIAIDNSTSVFHSLAVTLMTLGTLPCSRIYSPFNFLRSRISRVNKVAKSFRQRVIFVSMTSRSHPVPFVIFGTIVLLQSARTSRYREKLFLRLFVFITNKMFTERK